MIGFMTDEGQRLSQSDLGIGSFDFGFLMVSLNALRDSPDYAALVDLSSPAAERGKKIKL
jgi:hypothetical protein